MAASAVEAAADFFRKSRRLGEVVSRVMESKRLSIGIEI
jgi:hypothetical protein